MWNQKMIDEVNALPKEIGLTKTEELDLPDELTIDENGKLVGIYYNRKKACDDVSDKQAVAFRDTRRRRCW